MKGSWVEKATKALESWMEQPNKRNDDDNHNEDDDDMMMMMMMMIMEKG